MYEPIQKYRQIDSTKSQIGRNPDKELDQIKFVDPVSEGFKCLTMEHYHKVEKESNGAGDPHKVIMSGINYNMVLTGNPGSGKSTLARLIHQFFFAYGLIKRDVFVERNAGDLKAPYCGQTTI